MGDRKYWEECTRKGVFVWKIAPHWKYRKQTKIFKISKQDKKTGGKREEESLG